MTDQSASTTGLTVDQVSLWRGDRRLFHDLSFQLHPGQLMHLTGPNGVGKTSLLRVICGLTLPEQGSVSWNGEDTRRSRDRFAAALSYAGHREGLKDELTAVENLHTDLALRGCPFDQQVLTSVGLAGVQHLPVGRMSAGQRRRVMLARVIAANTPLWVLDEPFSNLDHEGSVFLKSTIESHVQNGGLVLMTAHQQLHLEGVEKRGLELQP